jgi:putative transposase
MPFVDVMIHAVWGTKNRFPYITKDIRSSIHEHIKSNAKEKNIFIDSINGVEDHLHVVFALRPSLSIAKTIQLIKGESSFWINKQKLIKNGFEWCDEYYAESVGRSHMGALRLYIQNQEEHHRRKTFKEECDEIFKGLLPFKD